MSYILDEDKPTGCIFCLAGDGVGVDNLVLGVGENCLVMMNKFPYNNGHLLIAPKRHLAHLHQLSPEESRELMELTNLSVEAIKKEMSPEGFNVGLNLGRVAGAGIEEHLHFHVVPRWNGDTSFMTVLDQVRVIPEHIRATYEKLRPHFGSLTQSKGDS